MMMMMMMMMMMAVVEAECVFSVSVQIIVVADKGLFEIVIV